MDLNIDAEDILESLQNEADREHINNMLPTVESWVTSNNKDFFFSLRCVDSIPSGLYAMTFNDNNGFGLSKMDYKSEEFFHLPSLPHKEIIKDLEIFWNNKQKFIDYNLNPKRGIILHGDPGCGKTSLIYLLVETIKKRDGISIYFDVPDNWVEIAKLVRKVEKDRPILCIIEDIDLVISKYGEESFLNFLDGLNSITNVVYVATTNNLEKIPDRIKDRPSRFDKKYVIKKPTEGDRKLYFETRLLDADKKKYDLKKLVKDTKDFTMAHLKEVFISLYILDNPYDEVISRLKKSKIMDNAIGFDLNGDDE
jgi:energy-coupling factor transporter ATP-binding protein EcfA2